MRIRKLAATTLLTIAATGVAAATAYGQTDVSAPAGAADSGVAYTAAVAPDRSSATVTLASGTFALTAGDGVAVLAPSGAVLATVPTTLRTATGQQVRVAPDVDAAATTLTLTPVGAAVPEPGAPQFIGDAGTTVAGVLIGCAVGALIGAIFLVVGLLPGCVVGGIIGGIVGANQ